MHPAPLSASLSAPLPPVPWRRAPLVYLILLLAVLAITWPWAATFSTHVLNHWDPPFHAWKLELVARSILSGHLVPPAGDTNVYYPFGGTLYYEALHWPQALAAAPLFALPGANPVFIYHVILVAFWALSGLCFWAFLRALGTTGRAALLGALFFTIMPYRTSYMVEFNMQLNFALPLFLFFFARYFQRPSIRYACGLALALFLQASSELYQAIFLALLLPALALPFLSTRPRLLLSGRAFWLPLLVAGLAALLAWPILGPYLTLLDTHTVNRTLSEISTHRLEPLSYLLSGRHIRFLPILPNVSHDEMSAYPSLALLLLAGLHLVLNARSVARAPHPRWILAADAIRWAALLLFGAATVLFHYAVPLRSAFLAHAYAALAVVAVLATLATLLHPGRRDLPYLFSAGLLAAAIFAFFLSLGPEIRMPGATVHIPNALFLWLYAHLQALAGFRVVSRFSIFVLLFLCVAAALAWDALERRFLAVPPRAGRLRRIFCASAFLLPALLCAAEAWPRHTAENLRPLPYPVQSPALDALDRLNAEAPHVLAIVPMGDRHFDSAHMLQLDRTDRLSVWAWGGAYPPYTQAVQYALRPKIADPPRAAALLRQLWPDVLLLEDLARSKALKTSYQALLAPFLDPVARDKKYVLSRLADPLDPAPEHIKLVRDDLLRANPLLSFTLEAPSGTPAGTSVWIDLNGYAIARLPLVPGQASTHTLRVPAPLIIDIEANRIRFHADADAPFFLRSYAQAPLPENAPGATPAPADCPPECPPWSAHLHALPPDALPLDLPYSSGLRFVAISLPDPDAPRAPGDSIHAVLYLQGRAGHGLRLSEALSASDAVLRLVPLAGGRWIEDRSDRRRSFLDPCDFLCQAHDAFHRIPVDIRIPEGLAPGDYSLTFLLQDASTHRALPSALPGHPKRHPLPFTIHIQ